MNLIAKLISSLRRLLNIHDSMSIGSKDDLIRLERMCSNFEKSIQKCDVIVESLENKYSLSQSKATKIILEDEIVTAKNQQQSDYADLCKCLAYKRIISTELEQVRIDNQLEEIGAVIRINELDLAEIEKHGIERTLDQQETKERTDVHIKTKEKTLSENPYNPDLEKYNKSADDMDLEPPQKVDNLVKKYE